MYTYLHKLVRTVCSVVHFKIVCVDQYPGIRCMIFTSVMVNTERVVFQNCARPSGRCYDIFYFCQNAFSTSWIIHHEMVITMQMYNIITSIMFRLEIEKSHPITLFWKFMYRFKRYISKHNIYAFPFNGDNYKLKGVHGLFCFFAIMYHINRILCKQKYLQNGPPETEVYRFC